MSESQNNVKNNNIITLFKYGNQMQQLTERQVILFKIWAKQSFSNSLTFVPFPMIYFANFTIFT